MRLITDTEDVRHYAGTYAEYAEYVSHDAPWDEFGARLSLRESSDWNGNRTYAQALQMVAAGYPEAAAKAKHVADSLSGLYAGVQPRPEIFYSFEGDDFEIDRWLERDEYMMDVHWKASSVSQRSIQFADIVVNCSYSYSIETEQVFNRGVIILAVVDLLETIGIRTSITLARRVSVSVRGRESKDLRFDIRIKDHDDPLSIDSLAYCVSCPSFLRRLGLRATEMQGRWGRAFRTTYGRPTEVKADDALYFPIIEPGSYRNLDKAGDEIKKILKKLDIDLDLSRQ